MDLYVYLKEVMARLSTQRAGGARELLPHHWQSIELRRTGTERGAARAAILRFIVHKNKTPVCVSKQGFWNSILTMTYSHMGKPHTTIGDASFHC